MHTFDRNNNKVSFQIEITIKILFFRFDSFVLLQTMENGQRIFLGYKNPIRIEKWKKWQKENERKKGKFGIWEEEKCKQLQWVKLCLKNAMM